MSTATVSPGQTATRVPARAAGVELLGELPGSGYRRPPALARRADGQVIQLTPLLYRVLEAVDGRRGLAELAEHVTVSYGRLVSVDNVGVLLDKLRPLGLLESPDGSQPVVRKANPLLGLRLRFVVSDPRLTRRITAPFAPLFHPLPVVAVVLAFAAVSYWVLFHKGLAGATYQALHEPGQLLLILAVTVASAGFHEFGHAAAARYGGATPGAMGAGLYLVRPAFYTDVTDSYRLGRAGRLRTDLGGLYFNAIVATAMFGLWAIIRRDVLLLIIAAQLLQMIRQLPPLVRYDGYHVLADLTGVPDLYLRIRPTLLGLLPRHWHDPQARALKPWARAVVTLWVLVAVPLLLFTLALMVVALPHIAATAWSALGQQGRLLHGAVTEGNHTLVAVRALAIVATGLPLLGIAYMLTRLVRRTTTRVWRATRGRPVLRVLAGLAGAAVLAGLAWAWWPGGGTYRPIQPGDRGTIGDAFGRAAPTPAGGVRRAASAPRSVRSARTVWPAGSTRPTQAHPRLAVVLTPKAVNAGPTWVFPFDRPAPPRPGDNQALAVNTTDGSTVYNVAFALVWVTGDDPVRNRNEAYAFADCHDCATVAVAFQVVLVVGQANVITPANLSGALNYSCVDCVTVALARQLVLTVPEDLGATTRSAIMDLWRQAENLAAHVTEMPLSQLHQQLDGIELGILDALRHDPAWTPPSTATVPPTATPPQSPSTTAESTPGTSTAQPNPPPTTETTPSPTEPSPTETTSPPPSSSTEPPS
jgi:putative peptide zinc metalloprotease protein